MSLYFYKKEGLKDTSYNFISKSEDIQKHIKNPNTDHYYSIYYYNEDQVEEAQKIIEVKNTAGKIYKRPRGVGRITDTSGNKYQTMEDVVTDRLVWDLDSEDVDLSRKDSVKLVDRLKKHGFEDNQIRVAFSGGKGFSVVVQLTEMINPEELKTFCTALGGDLATFDTKIYNPSRIFRVPHTKHHSGLFKTPIPIETLRDFKADDIKKIATERLDPEDLEGFYGVSELPNDFKEIQAAIPELKVNKSNDINLVSEISELDWSKRLKFLTPAKFILHNGLGYGAGQRHEVYMILSSSYKGAGFSQGDAYRLLKSVDEKHCEISGRDGFDHDELWTNIIDTVYSDSWQGGTYPPEHPILTAVEDAIPEHLQRKDKAGLIKGDVIFGQFKKFALEIDKNTIKTGIKAFDSKIKLLTGTTVGILGVPGCHARGSKVLMYDGTLKNVEDVQLGDFLMGPDSKSREVLDLISGKEKMVKFKPLRSPEFTVNQHHILHLEASKQKQKGKIPGPLHITVKDYIEGIKNGSAVLSGYRLHKVGVDFEEESQLPIEPYYVGLWLGDGHSANTRVTTMDSEVVNYLSNFADNYNLNFKEGENCGKATTYALTTGRGSKNWLLDEMRELELINNKHIPQIYKTSSRSDRMKLLAGLIDSDGYRESNGCGWDITQKSERLLRDIIFLAQSLGLHASYREHTSFCIYKGERREGIYHSSYISGLESILEVPVLLERKKPTRVMTSKDPSHYGFDFEELGEDEYFGFTLSDDHLYLTDDFFIHHNSAKTTLAMNLLTNCSQDGEDGIFYSLDMNASLIALKQVQKVTGFNNDKIMKMIKEDYVRFKRIEEQALKEWENVEYSFKFGVTPADIRQDIIDRQERTGKKVRVVVVDYLENVHSGSSDPSIGAGMVAQQLANIAAEENVLIVILMQTQKSVNPGDSITSMRKIKGASVIEQSVSVALGIHREGQPLQYKDYDNFLTVNILKNRFGPLETVNLWFDGAQSLVRDMDKDERMKMGALLQLKSDDKAEDDAETKTWGN